MLDQCILLSWFRRDDFFTGRSNIMYYGLVFFYALMDLFPTNTQFFISRCFYQLLFGLSFWWHPFTTEDSLVSKRYKAKFFQIISDKETNSSQVASRWINFKQIYIFRWTVTLTFSVRSLLSMFPVIRLFLPTCGWHFCWHRDDLIEDTPGKEVSGATEKNRQFWKSDKRNWKVKSTSGIPGRWL